jgi:hypothetical protein
MWACNCGEQIEDQFTVCWSCQLGEDGTPSRVYDEISALAKARLQNQLHPGEFLRHSAYGVMALSSRMKLLLSILGIVWAIGSSFSLQSFYSSNAWLASNPWSEAGNRMTTYALLAIMTSIFYIFARQFFVTNCFIGLTDQRIIAVLCKDDFRIRRVVDYQLEAPSSFKTFTEPTKATIEISGREGYLKAIIHQADMADNLSQAIEIAETIAKVRHNEADDKQTKHP